MGFRGLVYVTGLVDFRGPSRGPIKMPLKNECVEDRRSFFLRSNQIPEKTVRFSLKTFFFGAHIEILTKLVAVFPSVLEFTKPKMPNI